MDPLLAVILGSIFTSTTYLGIGLQKKGINHYQIFRNEGFESWLHKRDSYEWMIGCLAAAIGNILFFGLVGLSSFNLLMPLNGVGLILLTIFAITILKEEISMNEYLAIFCIVIGIGFSTIFSTETGENYDNTIFLVITLLLFIITVTLIILRILNNQIFHSVIESILAGILAVYSAFMAKNTSVFTEDWLSILFVILFFVFQYLSWVFMQLAYSTGKATTAVPIYTALLIILPIIGGVFIYGELLNLIQAIGILLVSIGGVILAKYAA